MTYPAQLFVAALDTVRADVGAILERLDQAASIIKSTTGLDVHTGEQGPVPVDPAFALGNRPAADPSGLTPDPAFSLGNTAAPVAPEPAPEAAAAPEATPQAPAPVEAAAEPSAASKVEWLREELAKAEAEAAAPQA